MKAAILAATIEASVVEPTALHRRESPALRFEMPSVQTPLDLNADVFRYLILRGTRCSRRHSAH